VNAVAAPASTTRRREEENMIEAQMRKNDENCKRYQQEQLKFISWQRRKSRTEWKGKVEISKLPREAMTSSRRLRIVTLCLIVVSKHYALVDIPAHWQPIIYFQGLILV
jgi:hypothetical protein